MPMKNKKTLKIIVLAIISVVIISFVQEIKHPVVLAIKLKQITAQAEGFLYTQFENGEEKNRMTFEYEKANCYHIDKKLYILNHIRIGYSFPYQLVEVYFTSGEDTYVVVFENDGKGNMSIKECVKNRGY